MKRILMIISIFSILSCTKKDINTDEDLIKFTWVLESATVSPQIMVNGKLTSDYKNASGPHSCLANSVLNFSSNGTYQFSSNGALCDTPPYTNDQKWTRDGQTVILKQQNSDIMATISGDKLTYTVSSVGVGSSQYVYTYKAKYN